MSSERPLVIGFVFDDTLDRYGGVAQHVTTLGAELARCGHSVAYLVGQSSLPELAGAPIYSLARNIDIAFNGNSLSMPLLSRLRDIRAALSAHDFDVLHVQVPFSPFMAARVVANAHPQTAVVGTFHVASELLLPRVGSRLLRLATARAVRRFDALASVSEVGRRFAREWFRLEVDEVIPNMVHVDSIKSAGGWRFLSDNVDIAFVGSLVPRKGARQLLDAFALLHRDHPHATLAIAGDGPLRQRLERIAQRCGLSHSVRFLGTISEAEKAALLRTATIACFPSRYGESFGIVLLEGMAAGANVVVGGRSEGHAEVLGHDRSMLVDADNVAGFAAALSRLLSDEQIRAELHARQQELVAAYDVSVVADRFLAMYRRALGRRLGNPVAAAVPPSAATGRGR